MYHPDLASAEANIRYDELLQRAETYRRIKRLERSNRGLNTGVASMLGDIVSALTSKVGLQAQQSLVINNRSQK
jgi:hypothetical protein